MKLAAIYTIWDDWELLEHSIRNISPLVEDIIVVYSVYSNYGEPSNFSINDSRGTYVNFEPDPNRQPRENETAKRNIGLQVAREMGCTHFLTMDADEFYEPEPFLKEVEKFKNPNLAGLVCQCQTYFKSPRLTIGLDTTLVPFIHKLTPTIRHEFNKQYPLSSGLPSLQ